MMQGVLWHAVSLSGERIEMGAPVEVIATERLTLYVDRLPSHEEKKDVPTLPHAGKGEVTITCVAPLYPRGPALYELYHEDDHRDKQQEMDEAPQGIGGDQAQEPQH